MKGIDVLIVRFLPFILFIVFSINMIGCYCGIDMILSYELHGNSALYALALYLISLSNKRYHCIWNRAMYLFLIFVPTLNFLDTAVCFLPSDKAYMTVVIISYLTTVLVTAYLAIRHFVQVSKRRMERGRE
jgi:hypothetical protein